jgi:hypothetical protein
MKTLATHCYESGSRRELNVQIIVARQIAQKGVDDPPPIIAGQEPTGEEALFNHGLVSITSVIKAVGSYAITQSDSELLYRCFEAFGWLGCSAVKLDNELVGTACLRSLSQLGREVRAKGLECFGGHCPLRPADHVREHIEYITSWIASLPEERQNTWAGVVEVAHSRLSGKQTKLVFSTTADGRKNINWEATGENHVEGFSMQSADRDIDYSDFTFLKDLVLHGYRVSASQEKLASLSFPGSGRVEPSAATPTTPA